MMGDLAPSLFGFWALPQIPYSVELQLLPQAKSAGLSSRKNLNAGWPTDGRRNQCGNERGWLSSTIGWGVYQFGRFQVARRSVLTVMFKDGSERKFAGAEAEKVKHILQDYSPPSA